jgi:hypothetical protein
VGSGSRARWEHAHSLRLWVAKAELSTRGGIASEADRDAGGSPVPALASRRQADFPEQTGFSAPSGFFWQGSCLIRAARPHAAPELRGARFEPSHSLTGCCDRRAQAVDEAGLAPLREPPTIVKGADGRTGSRARGLHRPPQIFHFSEL